MTAEPPVSIEGLSLLTLGEATTLHTTRQDTIPVTEVVRKMLWQVDNHGQDTARIEEYR